MSASKRISRKFTHQGTSHMDSDRVHHSSFWRQFRDDIITRDMDWIKRIHPDVQALESWMRENKYSGRISKDLLKNVQDGKSGVSLNMDRMKEL